jgi:integrase
MTTKHDETTKPKKRRRARGSGSVFMKNSVWWISYRDAAGRRRSESTGSTRKGDATRLLDRRNGARLNNLPVIPNAEKLTFCEAAQAVLDDFSTNKKRSERVVRRRIEKHLMPYFGNHRLAGITTADVNAYKAHRQRQGIVADRGAQKGERIRDVSNAEINRELATLKRVFSLAIQGGRIAMKPHIAMLAEASARSGFFEPDQLDSVVSHLPETIQPVIRFCAVTGWRISETLALEWRRVDLNAGEVRLDAGTTKNGAGRVFPFTRELRTLMEARDVERKKLVKAGHIVPWVFWRMVAEGRGGPKKPQPIVRFDKVWTQACRAAGCPGRLVHDLRRTAIRNFTRKGVPEVIAMRLSGHKTNSVFKRYDIVSSNDLRAAVDRLDADAISAKML